MKRLLLVGLLVLAPAAFGASSVLTGKGLFYSIEKPDEGNSVLLMRRSGGVKVMLVVPSTVDDTRDHFAQLEYDRVTDRLFVIWVRDAEKSSDVMMSWLDPDGSWSDPLVVASAVGGAAARDGLRTVLTRASADGTRATLIHVASWVRERDSLTGEYSLVAFESGRQTSISSATFEQLGDRALQMPLGDDVDVVTTFPALAMKAVADGIDLVYGREQGTTVTRLHIAPRMEPHARLWKPVGRSGGTMPPAHFAATSSTPVRALFSGDRVVLYTNEKVFRFVVFEGGTWSPAREFVLDHTLTGDALLSHIRQSIEEELTPEDVILMGQ